MSDYELEQATVKYSDWVLLNFVIAELRQEQINERRNSIYTPIFLTHNQLLKVRCTSMLIKGMTVDIMSGVIDTLIRMNFLKERNDSKSEFELTPSGNLFTVQRFNRILNFHEIKDIELADKPKFVQFFISSLKQKLGRDTTNNIIIWIGTEVLQNFYLDEWIKSIINLPKL